MENSKKERHALYVKLPDPGLKDRLEKAAVILDRPVAHFVRRTLEKELDKMAKKHPELAAA